MVALLLEMSEDGSKCIVGNEAVNLHVHAVNVRGIVEHTLEMAVFEKHKSLAVNEMCRIGRGCNHSRGTGMLCGRKAGDDDILAVLGYQSHGPASIHMHILHLYVLA